MLNFRAWSWQPVRGLHRSRESIRFGRQVLPGKQNFIFFSMEISDNSHLIINLKIYKDQRSGAAQEHQQLQLLEGQDQGQSAARLRSVGRLSDKRRVHVQLQGEAFRQRRREIVREFVQ